MRISALFLILTIVTATAKPAPKPTPKPRIVISDADRDATLEHIQRLAADSQAEAAKAKSDLVIVQSQLDVETKQHADALVESDALQIQINKVASDRDYWKAKDAEAVKKLWWWRLHFFIAGIIGIGLLVLVIGMKFFGWFAPVADKFITHA